jgi:hypothetical protein
MHKRFLQMPANGGIVATAIILSRFSAQAGRT